jgi:hypothetical protein
MIAVATALHPGVAGSQISARWNARKVYGLLFAPISHRRCALENRPMDIIRVDKAPTERHDSK